MGRQISLACVVLPQGGWLAVLVGEVIFTWDMVRTKGTQSITPDDHSDPEAAPFVN